MSRTVSYVNAFTAGELGPDVWERTDLQQNAKGCAEALNMVGLVTGPLASRGGFWDRGAVMDQTKRHRLVRFARSAEDALVLELGDRTMRVWTTAGDLVSVAGVPLVVATPWNLVQVQQQSFKQIGDVLYVTDIDGDPSRAIQRISDVSWTITQFDFRDGPWLAENVDAAVTLTISSHLVGDVTLTASADSFTAADVGSLIRVRQGDGNPGVGTWTAGTEYVGNAYVQYDGRVYVRESGNTRKSGTTPPVHQSGTVDDGAVKWTFRHDGAGLVKITEVTGPRNAKGRVSRRLPLNQESAGSVSTVYWAKQAYSLAEGYPCAVAEERDERLIFAASRRQPGTVDMTRTAGFGPGYGDFKPGLGTGRVVDDDAIRLNVGGASRVVWLLSASALVAGCTDGEYLLSGDTLDDPITPAGRRARPVSNYGSADVAPLLIQGPPPVIIHVLRSRTVVRELRASPDLSVQSRELSLLASHVFGLGVAEMAWQQPDNIIWMRMDDGSLAAMTYHLEHEVLGVTRQPLPEGWTVESLISAPTPDRGDVIMAIVRRDREDGVQRRVWRLSARRERMFMDGAQRYQGVPATTISGLDHREDETVAVLADGAVIADRVVAGGDVTLDVAASDVLVGWPLRRRFMSLPLDMEGPGSTNARTVVPTHATVIVEAASVDVGTDQPKSSARVSSREPGDLTAPMTRRKRARVALGAGSDRDRRIVIETSAPFDLTLFGYRLEAEVTS